MSRVSMTIIFLMVLTNAVQAEEINLRGQWDITIQFLADAGHHTALITQKGDSLSGTYTGDFSEGSLTGLIKDQTVFIHAVLPHPGRKLNYYYTGTMDGNTMTGSVDLDSSHEGEYNSASFTARKITE